MFIRKLLLSSVVLCLCIFPGLLYAALAPAGHSVGALHEEHWAGKVRTKVAQERDEEIRLRERFPFDKDKIRAFVTQRAAESIPYQCLEEIRNTVKEGRIPRKNTPSLSIYEVLQQQVIWDTADGTFSLRSMQLNTFAKLCWEQHQAGESLSYSTDQKLEGKARNLVVQEVMSTIDAMTEEDFLKPNNDRLRQLEGERKKCENNKMEANALKKERERQKAWARYNDRLFSAGLINYCSALASMVIPLPLFFMSKIPRLKKKFDSLLNQIHKDRLTRALQGAFVTNIVALVHSGNNVAARVKETHVCVNTAPILDHQYPSRTMIMRGPYALLNYMLLDLGYNYGSDFVDSKIGSNWLIKRCRNAQRRCESRLRKRFKYYDRLKRVIGYGVKTSISLYGAHEYIDGSINGAPAFIYDSPKY